jgi:hypothetical protein
MAALIWRPTPTPWKTHKENLTMSKTRTILNIVGIMMFLFAVTSLAQAQATRTWVSGVGDDANPCSRTAPCKTFAGAISKTAIAGEISVLDPGGFGVVTITKSITIDGDGTLAGILSAGTSGVFVNDSGSASPGTAVVYLRSLSINGAGTGTNGVNFTSGGKVFVENCTFTGMQTGINVNLASSGKNIFVKNTSIRNCTVNGISVQTSSGFVAGVFDRVSVEGLPTGITVGNSAFISIRDSSISLNTSTGVNISGSGGATASIENCLLNNNPTAINVGASNILNLSSSTLESNTTAVASAAPAANLHSSGNNRFLGNTSDGAALTVTLQK